MKIDNHVFAAWLPKEKVFYHIIEMVFVHYYVTYRYIIQIA